MLGVRWKDTQTVHQLHNAPLKRPHHPSSGWKALGFKPFDQILSEKTVFSSLKMRRQSKFSGSDVDCDIFQAYQCSSYSSNAKYTCFTPQRRPFTTINRVISVLPRGNFPQNFVGKALWIQTHFVLHLPKGVFKWRSTHFRWSGPLTALARRLKPLLYCQHFSLLDCMDR